MCDQHLSSTCTCMHLLLRSCSFVSAKDNNGFIVFGISKDSESLVVREFDLLYDVPTRTVIVVTKELN